MDLLGGRQKQQQQQPPPPQEDAGKPKAPHVERKGAVQERRRFSGSGRQSDAACRGELEKHDGKGPSEEVLCPERNVQDGNLVNKTSADNIMLSVFPAVVIDDESRKTLEKGGDASKQDERNYCTVEVPESASPQPSVVGCQQLSFTNICRQLPDYFDDVNFDPSIVGPELNQGLPNQLQSENQEYYLHNTNQETNKKRSNRILAVGSSKASVVALGDMCIHEHSQDTTQNVSLGPATRRSARCTAANSTGQPSFRHCSFQISKGSQDEIKDREGRQVPPEEPVPPTRKKTRTFYSAEQLEELEQMFQEDHYPDSDKRREIATAVGVSPQRVMVWFQNRRAKWRKIKKLTIKGNKKSPSALSICPQQNSQGTTTVVPVPPFSGPPQDQPGILKMAPARVTYSSTLNGQPVPIASAPVASVTGTVTAIQTKAVPQGTFGSLKEELFPVIPSPPPIQRASLPINMVFNSNSHLVPLMLDTPTSEYSPSSQEISSSEAFTCSIHSQSNNSPVRCHYPEQLEPTANLEATYYPPTNPPGTYQFSQYSQHQVSQLHHYPVHLAGSMLPSVRLIPATPSKSNTAFFSVSANSGLMTYGTAETSRGYIPNHVGGQLLIQPSGGSSGYISTFQAVPWNDFYLQGAPFSNQHVSQVPFSGSGGGGYSAEQNLCAPPTSCLHPLTRAPLPGSTLLFTAKQAMLVDPNSNSDQQSEAQLTEPPEKECNSGNMPQEDETVADFSEENKN